MKEEFKLTLAGGIIEGWVVRLLIETKLFSIEQFRQRKQYDEYYSDINDVSIKLTIGDIVKLSKILTLTVDNCYIEMK